MVSPKGQDPVYSLLNKKSGMILYDDKRLCSISVVAMDLAAIQQTPQPAFNTVFLFLLLFGCKLILTEDLLVTSC
jgi:hypothetical protein